MEGATTENSPFSLFFIKESCSTYPECDFTDDLSINPYAWNNHANIM
jgi:hypothetical protein